MKSPDEPARLLTKDDLLRHADLYAHYGFSREWILAAEPIDITVTDKVVWSGCNNNGTGPDGLYDFGNVTTANMATILHQGQTIHAIGTADKWIALMCGNFVIQEPPVDFEKVGFDVNAPAQIPSDKMSRSPSGRRSRTTVRHHPRIQRSMSRPSPVPTAP